MIFSARWCENHTVHTENLPIIHRRNLSNHDVKLTDFSIVTVKRRDVFNKCLFHESTWNRSHLTKLQLSLLRVPHGFLCRHGGNHKGQGRAYPLSGADFTPVF